MSQLLSLTYRHGLQTQPDKIPVQTQKVHCQAGKIKQKIPIALLRYKFRHKTSLSVQVIFILPILELITDICCYNQQIYSASLFNLSKSNMMYIMYSLQESNLAINIRSFVYLNLHLFYFDRLALNLQPEKNL